MIGMIGEYDMQRLRSCIAPIGEGPKEWEAEGVGRKGGDEVGNECTPFKLHP